MSRVLSAVVLLLLGVSVAAEPLPFTAHTLRAAPGDAAPPATIETMAWLAGRWRTEAFGGTGEETWLPPAAGAMAGIYRQRDDAETAFYEMLVIREVEGSLLLQLRHFDEALVGWEAREETVDFPLVAVEDRAMHFEGMSFHRLGADTMRVYLAVDDGAGEVRFDYERF